MHEGPLQGPPPPDKEAERARLLERAGDLFKNMARGWAVLLAGMKLAPDRRSWEPKSRQEVEFGQRLFSYLHDEYDPRLDAYRRLIDTSVVPHVWNFDPPPGSPRSWAQRGANEAMKELTKIAKILGTEPGPLFRANMMDLRAAGLVLGNPPELTH